MALDGGRRLLDVVVVDDDGLRDDRCRDAGRGRDAERREARSGLGEEGVGVAVVAAGELRAGASCPCTPAPAASADIAASVPEETSRTCSIEGTASAISSASSTSRSVGAPKLVPARAAACTASTVSAVGVAEDERPPGLDPVEQPAAVGRLEVRALAASDEEGLGDADGAHRPYGRVDAAGDPPLCPPPELGRL